MSEHTAEKGLRKRLRPFLPNRSDALALVSLNDQRPFRAYWPLTLVQIVGGRTWSISFVRYRTPRPRVIPPARTEGGR